MMPTTLRLRHLIFAILCVFGFIAWFDSLRRAYPFYFMWDMDLTYVFDSILIQSKQLPDHYNHPGFGAYLLFKLTHSLAYILGLVSILDLPSIPAALNPIFGVVELTDFFRAHSPYICALSALFLWLALLVSQKTQPLLSLLQLILIFSLAPWAYHSTMIRSELYAVFFWSIALLCTAAAARSTSVKAHSRALLITGLFIGLSYLTKLQALFYLPALALLYRFWLQNNQENFLAQWPTNEKTEKRLAWALAIFFPLLVLLAKFRSIDGAAFTDQYPLNAVGLAMIVLPLLLLGWQTGKIKWGQSWIRLELPWILRLLAGFALSFFLHFLLFPSQPAQAFKYLLINAKMLFYRNNYQSLNLIYAAWDSLSSLWLYNPLFYSAAIALCALSLWSLRNSKKIIFAAGGLLFVLLSMSVGVRPVLRDTIWAELLLLIWSLVLAQASLGQSSEKVWQKVSLYFLLAIILLANFIGTNELFTRINKNYNFYGWIPEKMFDGMFINRQIQYADLMTAEYAPSSEKKKIAIRTAKDYATFKRDAIFAFPSQNITLAQLSMIQKDFPVWLRDKNWLIDSYSASLQGAISFDASAIAPTKKSLRRELDTNHVGALAPLSRLPQDIALSVLPRNDLQVWAFVPKSDIGAWLKTKGSSLANLQLVLKHKEQPRQILVGIALSQAADIDAALLRQGNNNYSPVVFVVKNSLFGN